MARHAIRSKLVIMHIIMAVRAIDCVKMVKILKNIWRLDTCVMTTRAIDALMLTSQRKVRGIVIEASPTGYGMKRFFGMALCAVITKSTFMFVVVASCTILECDSSKLLKLSSVERSDFMTGCTIHRLMFADQREFCDAMIKQISWPECFRSMAADAI